MRSFAVSSPDAVTAALNRKATDNWRLFDSPAELADFAQANCQNARNWRDANGSWYGGAKSANEIAQKTRGGDLSGVPASDALLERFERFAFETERPTWRDDIAGGFPNVPAFLAGHPLAMRRRINDASAAAPLAIVVDLATSAGISAETIRRRGAAVLALSRLLTMRRPVELWAGCMTAAGPSDRNLAAIFCRIETAPLDLATAAYVMTSAGFPRCLCYATADVECGFVVNWPYSSFSASSANMAAICAQGFTHATETLCIQPAHYNDDISENPEAWIERKLAELAPVNLEAAE